MQFVNNLGVQNSVVLANQVQFVSPGGTGNQVNNSTNQVLVMSPNQQVTTYTTATVLPSTVQISSGDNTGATSGQQITVVQQAVTVSQSAGVIATQAQQQQQLVVSQPVQEQPQEQEEEQAQTSTGEEQEDQTISTNTSEQTEQPEESVTQTAEDKEEKASRQISTLSIKLGRKFKNKMKKNKKKKDRSKKSQTPTIATMLQANNRVTQMDAQVKNNMLDAIERVAKNEDSIRHSEDGSIISSPQMLNEEKPGEASATASSLPQQVIIGGPNMEQTTSSPSKPVAHQGIDPNMLQMLQTVNPQMYEQVIVAQQQQQQVPTAAQLLHSITQMHAANPEPSTQSTPTASSPIMEKTEEDSPTPSALPSQHSSSTGDSPTDTLPNPSNLTKAVSDVSQKLQIFGDFLDSSDTPKHKAKKPGKRGRPKGTKKPLNNVLHHLHSVKNSQLGDSIAIGQTTELTNLKDTVLKDFPQSPKQSTSEEGAYNEVFSEESGTVNPVTSDMDISAHSSSSQSPNDSTRDRLSADAATDDSGINCDQRSEGSDKSEPQAAQHRGKKRELDDEEEEELLEEEGKPWY